MPDLDHLIVRVNDLKACVVFYTDIMGFQLEGMDGPFTIIRVSDSFVIQLTPYGTAGSEHYAFAVSRSEFDAILSRVQGAGLGDGPSFNTVGSNSGPGEERGARGMAPTVYFFDPSRHLIEIRTYET